MPTYSYRCTECDNAFDIQQAFTDDSLTVCPVCGGALRKVFSAVGISFSGSGFYRTDSRPAPPSEGGSSSSSDSSSDSGSGSAGSAGSGSGSDKAGSDSGKSAGSGGTGTGSGGAGSGSGSGSGSGAGPKKDTKPASSGTSGPAST